MSGSQICYQKVILPRVASEGFEVETLPKQIASSNTEFRRKWRNPVNAECQMVKSTDLAGELQ
jgi:hypothetical protein